MPLYICRWPNGDFSAAFATNRERADCMFDEVGNADEGKVFIAPDFMVHFSLKEKPDGVDDWTPFELEGFGEDFSDQILEKAYLPYRTAVTDDDSTEESIAIALAHEKTRLWGKKKPKQSKDREVRELQEAGLDIPAAVARIVITQAKAERNKELMESVDPNAKPQ